MNQSINLGNTEVINFNGLEVDVLQLNGKELWNNLSEQVGQDLNYIGLDVNGNEEYSLDFDGNIVAYAVGKPIVYYYEQVIPTPTTQEGYDGKYVYGTLGGLVLTNDSYAGDIVIGETPCYTRLEEKTSQTVDWSVLYPCCSGYNSQYYNNYDFSTVVKVSDIPYSESNRIVPEILEIPDTHNGLPVIRILPKAFYGGVFTTQDGVHYLSSYTQASYIKDIVFGSNIQTIDTDNFNGLINYGIIDGVETKTTFYIPESVKTVGLDCFTALGYNNSILYKFIIPEGLETISGYLIEYSNCSYIIYKSRQAMPSDLIMTGYLDNGGPLYTRNYDVIFKKSVKSLNGSVFYNKIPNNIVFEHTDEDEITINIGSPKSAKSTNIYTDSTYVRNYDWAGKNITPTFYSLSEYTGELE